MNFNQPSSAQFMLYLKSMGGSEADVAGAACSVSDGDTVETVVSRMRREKYAQGKSIVDPLYLQVCAQVVISRRDENKTLHRPQLP